MTKNINWDLSDFYKNLDDPQITKDKKEIEKLALSFTQAYKNKINSQKLTAQLLLKALTDFQNLLEKLFILENYAALTFSTATDNEKIKAFYQQTQEFQTKINSLLVWFTLEIIALDNTIFKKIIKDKKLNSFQHFLALTRVSKPFTLTEKEEKIMNDKSQTSNAAFIRLYDELEGSEKFKLAIKGKTQILNSSQIGSLMKSYPDRKVRERAVSVYSQTYAKNSKLYTYILNTLILDKKINDEIRGFKFPQQNTLINYEINLEMVNTMSDVIKKNKKLVESYYLQKGKLLKEKLYEWDRYSYIYKTKEKKYSWNEAQELILITFKEFSPVFYEVAKLFFDNNWIDADIHPGKRSGAYCSFNVPSLHPLIFINYSGKLEDITTLAHELGHGIHAYLARKNGLLQFHASTATAEIASTFCEALVFEKLYSKLTDKKEKINLLANKLQNEFATIFRQNDFYEFETKIHETRRQKGELTNTVIGDLYQTTLQRTFGKGLTLTAHHKNMWMPILHFYHYNFYVFTYCFGDLLALSLFNLYKNRDKKFVGNYIQALSFGGSKSPLETTKIMGVNIEHKDFWKNGLALIAKELDEFVKLTT